MPYQEKLAVRGIAPYMQSGEAIPSILAGTTPNAPSIVPLKERISSWIKANQSKLKSLFQ